MIAVLVAAAACTAPGVNPSNPFSVAAAVQAGTLSPSCLAQFVDPTTSAGRYAWVVAGRPFAVVRAGYSVAD